MPRRTEVDCCRMQYRPVLVGSTTGSRSCPGGSAALLPSEKQQITQSAERAIDEQILSTPVFLRTVRKHLTPMAKAGIKVGVKQYIQMDRPKAEVIGPIG